MTLCVFLVDGDDEDVCYVLSVCPEVNRNEILSQSGIRVLFECYECITAMSFERFDEPVIDSYNFFVTNDETTKIVGNL